MMTTDTIYIATVYGKAMVAKDHATMRDAFAWVKGTIASDRDWFTHGDVRLYGDKLVYFDPRETIWYGDGYARWEATA